MKRRCSSFKTLKMLGAVGILLYVSVIFAQQHGKIKQYNETIGLYESKIKNEQVISAQLYKQLEMLETDEYVEQQARRRLGFVYPDEKIFVGFVQ